MNKQEFLDLIVQMFNVQRSEVKKPLEYYNIQKRSPREVHCFQKTLEKAKTTCLNKYGVTNYAKSEMFKDNYYLNMKETKAKEFATKNSKKHFQVLNQKLNFINIFVNNMETLMSSNNIKINGIHMHVISI